MSHLRRGQNDIAVTAEFGGSSIDDLTPFQQEILVERMLQEAVDQLEYIAALAKTLVPGGTCWPEYVRNLNEVAPEEGDRELRIGSHQLMGDWQRPLMQRLATIVHGPDRDVLEVGFGLGLASEAIQQLGARSHTIVESHPVIAERARAWAATHPERHIKVIEGRWSDIPFSQEFDSILFDPYPMSEEEYRKAWHAPATLASVGFEYCARALRDGGVFTYFSNEIDSISRTHQRALLDYFSSMRISVLQDFQPPEDCYYWWAPSIAVVEAQK